jgi:hypothetical protein
VRIAAAVSCSSARLAANRARSADSVSPGSAKRRDCASEPIIARIDLSSRPPSSNKMRSKFEATWMSIDGDEVATTSRVSYDPVASVRARMSLTLVAITSFSIGRPMRLAT